MPGPVGHTTKPNEAIDLARLLSLSSDAIFVRDSENRIIYWNEGAQELYGYSQAEALGQISHDLLRTDFSTPLSEITTVLNEKGRWHGELTHFCRDGRSITVFSRWVLDRDASGQGRILETNNDISDQKRQEQKPLSEARFKSLVEQLPLSLQIVDASGRTVRVNRAWEQLWGITLEMLHDYNLLQDQQLVDKGIMPYIQRALVGQPAEVPPIPYVPDRGEFKGQDRWTRALIFPVLDDDRSVREIVLIHEDVTERKRAEDAVRSSEEQLRSMFMSTAVGIAQGDPKTKRFVRVNGALCHLIGYSEAELLQRTFYELTHPDDREADAARFNALVRGEVQSYNSEKRYLRADGSAVWVYVTANLIRDRDGNPWRTTAVIQDINARKEAREALRRSEEQLRLITANAPFLISYIDRDLVYRFTNAAYVDWFGPPGENLVGRTLREVMGDELYRQRQEHLEAVLRGEGRRFEAWTPHYRLGLRLTDIVYIPDKSPDGQVRGFYAFVQNIHERKETEQKLRLSEERLRLATQTGKVGLWDWDIAANQVTWTDSLYAIHGVEKKSFGHTVDAFAELVHPDDRAMMADAMQSTLQDGKPFEVMFRAVRPSGEVIWLFTNAVVIQTDGRPQRLIGATFDVSDLKRAEEALRAAQEQLQKHATNLEQQVQERTARLQETVGELEHFSYTITHDMRAPLRAMHGYGQVLQEEYSQALDTTGQAYLQRIIQSAKRMDRLILDALSYSKAVQAELPLETVDVRSLLDGIINSYPQFQSPHAEIRLEGEFPAVRGTESALTQCFSNLLGNAVKFVEPSKTPFVRVWAERRESRVRIWIEDNGIGIAPEHQQRIFNLFQRLEKRYEGTGLGLALVRKVVQRMRGSLGVESELGKGSRFWIELPHAD